MRSLQSVASSAGDVATNEEMVDVMVVEGRSVGTTWFGDSTFWAEVVGSLTDNDCRGTGGIGNSLGTESVDRPDTSLLLKSIT